MMTGILYQRDYNDLNSDTAYKGLSSPQSLAVSASPGEIILIINIRILICEPDISHANQFL